MSTPRVTVDETLLPNRVVVTDTAPRINVTELGSTSGVQVTVNSEAISVVLSPSAAGVSSVNGVTGVVTGIATSSEVSGAIAAIDFPVDSVNGSTGTVVLTTSNVAEGTNEYYTSTRVNSAFDTRLALKTTDDVAVGSTNMYFTTTLARTAITASGSLSYDSDTGVVSYTTPATVSSLSNHTTDDLTQGSTNKYFSNTLARTAVSASGSLSYNSATGDFSYTTPATVSSLSNHTTTGLAEGTNLYFTNQRAVDAVGGVSGVITPARWDSPYTQNGYTRGFAQWAAGGTTNFTVNNTSSLNDITALSVSGWSSHAAPLQNWTASGSTVAAMSTSGVLSADSIALTTYPTTTNIGEGTNLYYTDTRADARVATGIANLVDSAPATLDTLNELAAALGDDPNFATSIATSIGTKLATADFTATADGWYATSDPIQNNTTDDVAEGALNLYYTDARGRNAITASGSLSYDPNTGTVSYTTPSTDGITEGSTNLYYTDARVSTRINNTSIDALSDVVITSAASGQMMYYNGTNWVNSVTVDSANLNRFSRTATGTGSNAVVELSRNRGDAARAVDGGPWLGFAYVGTDNTQANAVQHLIQSRYQTSGNHQLRFLHAAGNYASPTVMGQIQRGSTFFNNTSGGNMLSLSDTTATVRGTTTTIANSPGTTTYATFIPTAVTLNGDTVNLRNSAGTTTYGLFSSTGTTITGAGLSQITRTTVGTPGVAEGRPSFNIQLSRSDQAAPNDNDGTGFRYRLNGSNATDYTIADMSANYRTGGDNIWSLNLANGDQTTGTFSGLTTIQSKITSTTIRAGTASGTPGGSSVSDIMVISDANILNNRAHRNAITTGTVARGGEYAVPATANGSIELTITAGSGTTHIDVDAVASDAGTGGMYSILIYNNSGDNNIDVQVRNNGANIGVAKNLDIGIRAMASVYVVGGYAACEIMDAA